MYYNALMLGLILVIFSSCEKPEEEVPLDDNTVKLTPADFTLGWEKAWGTPFADDFSGAVIDNSGNIYFTGSTQPDGYAANIFVTKMNASTQVVEWSQVLDLDFQDFYPSAGENGHSQGGGGSRCISIDNEGNVYIAGASKQGFNEVFCVKINTSGTIVWQQFWEADNSDLARGSAKAYALDVNNGKVYITGTTGAGVGTEESNMFLLVLNSTDGTINPNTILGIDASLGYNDRGYTIKVNDNNDVYVAGWEGKNNSGFLMKYSNSGTTFEWYKRMGIGYAARINDIDFDASGNIYLAADIRGVSTYLGIIKADANGNVLWAKQMQGEANDRNNVSCVRVVNSSVYVGGRGAYTNYDVSQYGDGCLYQLDASGNILKLYNYFTSKEGGDRCGERMEAILPYNGGLILAGETWPEASKIKGSWYMPTGVSSDLYVTVTQVSNATFIPDDGVSVSRNFSQSSSLIQSHNTVDGSKGSADVILFNIIP